MPRAIPLMAAMTLVTGTALAQSLSIVAPAAPGGGWDQTARVMQRVLGEVEPGASVQVDNVPGAAGTIGLARFVQSERGNPGALLVTGLVMVSGVITNASPVSLADATPIARLTGEYEVIAVPASSPLATIHDLVDAFRRDPGAVSWGGGSAGGTDDLLVRLLAEQLGLPASRVNYIAFSGGGAALAAVLGGQVTAGVSGYGEFAGQIEAGQLRVLAVSSAARVPGIDAPTLRESGIALDLANWRALVAPPGLSDAETDALIARVTRMATSPAWRTALTDNGWEDLYLPGTAFRQFLLSEQARISAVLQRLAAGDTTTTELTVTPTTVPTAMAWLFGAMLVATVVLTRGRGEAVHAWPAVSALAAGLFLQPLLYLGAGFVAASTVTFAVTSTAVRGRRPSARDAARDVVIGLAFALVLFFAFSRGLGVALP